MNESFNEKAKRTKERIEKITHKVSQLVHR